MEREERVTELLLAGLAGWLLSDCETESLEVFVVEPDLTVELPLGAREVGCDPFRSDEAKRGVSGGVRSQS